MKRYLVWAGATYYAAGPARDFIGDFDTLDDVGENSKIRTVKAAYGHDVEGVSKDDILFSCDWIRILDTSSGEWVEPLGDIYGEDEDG